ncbi:hypothetical protein V2J09_017810 [Rumex salicifolius]
MAFRFESNGYCWLLLLIMAALAWGSAYANFFQDFEPTFGDHRVKRYDGGKLLSLTLDKYSGSGFKSKKDYLFGRIDMQIKLIPGDSAGTVTTYYLSSKGAAWDEVDFEFLGNMSGHPYTLHTNVFAQGKGNREQQFFLWFDPTKSFHTYSIVWHPTMIIFLVDNTPIRAFKNHEANGVPFPKDQPMRVYSSLWNADDWATQGGRVKTDWAKGPFVAHYQNFKLDTSPTAFNQGTWKTKQNGIELDDKSKRRLRWVQRNFMVYNYCTDSKRFPQGLPVECKI